MKQGADMFQKDKLGMTPFHVACEKNSKTVIDLFLQNLEGKDINILTSDRIFLLIIKHLFLLLFKIIIYIS